MSRMPSKSFGLRGHLHTQSVEYSLCCARSLPLCQLFATLWTVACQAPVSMGFSKLGYWSGLPCPPPGDLPDPGTEPTYLMSPSLSGSFFTTSLGLCFACG